ncbi:site-specific integrase [uncultured Mucilaginibacter sp.]|uniref:site-specific integrase n=1 Tax=uncultured Mucilaginibacter sp. TaxID=797541 RepID=UPI0025F64C95|nr:site-specific integrase [uncultured Mucilaginibacter sp.]
MAKPKFYLEPRPAENGKQAINMFYSFNGQRLQYYTGIRIEVKYFRPECNTSDVIKPIKSTAPFATQNNKKLAEMALDAVSIECNAKGENLTAKFVKEQLDLIYKPKIKAVKQLTEPEINHTFVTFFEQIIKDTICGKRLISVGKNNGSRYTRNAYKNYGITLSAVKRYMKYMGITTLPFETINKEFYENFRFYCYNIENKEKSTFGSYIKDIKTVMSESNAPGFKTKDYIIPSYEADTLYLTVEQINQISILDLSDKTKFHIHTKGDEVFKIGYPTLDKVRDLFLIGCYTGLRFSDFNTLDIQSIDGDFIKIKQIKTGSRVTIPIMNKLRPVLSKYSDNLPTISNQKFNDYIKIVAQLAGLTQTRKTTNTKGNIENEDIQPLYSLVTSHCCRRSYATNMFKAGVPPMFIMSATGHKTETSFLKYIRANNDDKAKLLAQTLQKLGL